MNIIIKCNIFISSSNSSKVANCTVYGTAWMTVPITAQHALLAWSVRLTAQHALLAWSVRLTAQHALLHEVYGLRHSMHCCMKCTAYGTAGTACMKCTAYGTAFTDCLHEVYGLRHSRHCLPDCISLMAQQALLACSIRLSALLPAVYGLRHCLHDCTNDAQQALLLWEPTIPLIV